ncbi:uncharacterized protein BDR25DRAFT_375203 [Lindgomyces ingoldianus]|uniref:Uncharacterized protein n=1 Tax=Lindgomyces ingoldianus TaxID=673940 RepID=A0ACB6RC68_9PLEO|nr:uncharacterized protein BDR25DRAFT_375203 [Lindgomyces ingoldianus]KAF2476320.1 hypothetical protein BDR25DRAFT_375203 [Lindgomyces ingoldianus]
MPFLPGLGPLSSPGQSDSLPSPPLSLIRVSSTGTMVVHRARRDSLPCLRSFHQAMMEGMESRSRKPWPPFTRNGSDRTLWLEGISDTDTVAAGESAPLWHGALCHSFLDGHLSGIDYSVPCLRGGSDARRQNDSIGSFTGNILPDDISSASVWVFQEAERSFCEKVQLAQCEIERMKSLSTFLQSGNREYSYSLLRPLTGLHKSASSKSLIIPSKHKLEAVDSRSLGHPIESLAKDHPVWQFRRRRAELRRLRNTVPQLIRVHGLLLGSLAEVHARVELAQVECFLRGLSSFRMDKQGGAKTEEDKEFGSTLLDTLVNRAEQAMQKLDQLAEQMPKSPYEKELSESWAIVLQTELYRTSNSSPTLTPQSNAHLHDYTEVLSRLHALSLSRVGEC